MAGQPPRYYLRNREVTGKVVGSDIFLEESGLQRYLNAEELQRIGRDTQGRVTLDGQSAPEGPGISLQWLASGLGFVQRKSPQAVDWVKLPSTPDSPSDPKVRQELSSRRPEYREAGRRMALIQQELPLSPRPELQARVERIGNLVVAASPLRDLKWNFSVVSMPAPNAACTGEGYVFVTDSLLDMGISDDELAGVMGHEVAHGVRRHVFRRSDLLRNIQQLILDYQSLQARIDSGERSLTLSQQVRDYGKRRDQLQYQFDNERFYTLVDEEEADVLGLRYAVTAGFSADGLGSCLGKLEKRMVEQFGTAVLKDDMSHPPTKRRLDILQRARRNAGF